MGFKMNTPHSQPSALSSGHFETNGKSRRKNSRKKAGVVTSYISMLESSPKIP